MRNGVRINGGDREVNRGVINININRYQTVCVLVQI